MIFSSWVRLITVVILPVAESFNPITSHHEQSDTQVQWKECEFILKMSKVRKKSKGGGDFLSLSSSSSFQQQSSMSFRQIGPHSLPLIKSFSFRPPFTTFHHFPLSTALKTH